MSSEPGAGQNEQLADLVSWRAKSSDLEEERRTVRARLLRELDANSRELLLRLSLLTNYFDRPIVLAVSEVPAALPQPGMVFDALVGPWIEQVGSARYRLSPLLQDSGEVSLTETQRTNLRSAVVQHLMHRRPFPADQLMQLFVFAFALKSIPALTWFSGALVHTANRGKDAFKRLAEEVSVFAIVDRGEKNLLFPEKPQVSVMLRYAQLRVAIANEEPKRAARILDRLLFEIEHLTGASKSNSLMLALSTALIERSVPLPPTRWLSMLQTLTAIPEMQRLLRKRPSHADPFSGLTIFASHAEMIFIIRATALSGIDQLGELVEALDSLPVAIRDSYLAAASNVLHSVGHIVASAWLSGVRSKGFDGKAAAAKLGALGEVTSRWKNLDMSVEIVCAQAVMLDEYAGDKDEALRILGEAQAKYPRDYRINRQRQKIYYRNGNHALALAEFESFASRLPATNLVDRAFAMREAGRSAAEVGELDKTRIFFEQAWEAARKCGEHMRPMVAGLSADCAILDFQSGKTESALNLMLRALREAEFIDPKAGPKEHYCVLILMAAILWMRGSAADWPIERQAMLIGMCSNPAPLPEIKDRPLPQRLLPWYELAELEAEISDGQFVLDALRERTAKGGLLPMEISLASRLMQAAVRSLNVGQFFDALPIYSRAIIEGVKSASSRQTFDILAMPAGMLKPIRTDEWRENAVCEATTSAVLVFLTTALCSGRRDAFDSTHARLLQTEGLGASIAPLFDTIMEPPVKPDDLIVAVASTVGRMLRPDFVFNADEAFMATVYLVQFVSGHVLGETAAGPIIEYFGKIWRDILDNRTFSVRSPSTTGPFILAALSKGHSNRAKFANLVLASEAAVRAHLSDELRGNIRALTKAKRTSLEELQSPDSSEESD